MTLKTFRYENNQCTCWKKKKKKKECKKISAIAIFSKLKPE